MPKKEKKLTLMNSKTPLNMENFINIPMSLKGVKMKINF
jgi:hypothetical protein